MVSCMYTQKFVHSVVRSFYRASPALITTPTSHSYSSGIAWRLYYHTTTTNFAQLNAIPTNAAPKRRSTTTTTTRRRRKRAEEAKRRAAAAAAVAAAPVEVPWTNQQLQVLKAVAEGKSVFITGSAGTGKTILLKRVVEVLKQLHTRKSVFVTASTGVAACALSGQTLHSFAGIGFGDGDRESLLLTAKSKSSYRWKRARALVIDEISMVDADLFDTLEYIAREIRRKESGRPWSGLQLIVSGDFFQLPPIGNRLSLSGKEFAFEADCWDRSFDLQIELTQVFRQSDLKLVELLQGIRRGDNDPERLKLLQDRTVTSEPDFSVTRLFPRKNDVSRVNKERLRSLGRETVTYTALDVGQEPWKSQLKLGITPDEVELCVGARVMLLKNIAQWDGLVNGATGTITGFKQRETVAIDICCSQLLPSVQFDSGPEIVILPEKWNVMEGDTVLATRKQIPLMLAWALSIHKCQGMTLNCLNTDLSRAFGCGMVYVALSRVRSLEGLYLSGFNPSKIKAHPKVLEFYQRLYYSQNLSSF
ncbi:PREDICTED: ATP-dependent DNA helicase PIF1-like [Nelumbo nucifera]|uniref:ATP-dependent DNA helicase n=2 Tax=Nelumbo nucifera TaxID=4432 RepID=A0A822Y623_NELNU|nr:PREDICTED: ATP-dependent DNA helicase PIF1-like [Nelumbo nucifera]DAD25048.1 TPA_asm: hypothetical protein HUJ06_026512 [Nelumbo nucifera]